MLFKFKKIILLLLFLSVPAYADIIMFSASVDKSKVALNDYFVYSLSVSGENATLPTPEIGELEDFKIYGTGRSQNISFINGKRNNSVTHKYTLVPKKTGKFTIPPVKIEYKKKTYFTEPLDIEVTEAEKIQSASVQQTSSPKNQSAARNAPAAKGNLFVKASVDKKKPYINEKIIYKFSFYTNVDLVSNPEYYQPEFKGFWKDLSTPKNRYETIDGVNYLVNEIETVLYPIESGTLTIGPAKLRVAVMDFSSPGSVDDFFSLFVNMGQRQEKIMETDSISLDVQPLPKENVPPDFKGAVGSFKISAEPEKNEAVTNEPLSLNVKVTGKGNMKSINDIEFKPSKDFRVYDTVSANVTEDSREFQILLVPLAPGEKTIPPVKLSFFDPSKNAYSQVETQPLKIKVEGAAVIAPENNFDNNAMSSVQVKNDINYNKDIKKIKSHYKGYFVENKIFFLIFVPFILLFTFSLAYRIYSRKKNNDPVSRLKSEACEQSKECIAAASGKAKAEKCHDFYEALYEALTAAATAETGIESGNLSVGEISANLEKSGLDKSEVKEIEEIFNRINFFRFASVKSDEKSMKELLSKTEKILNALRNR